MYDFSIITPSHNMLDHLRCCAASVRDQRGGGVQHIIVDNASDDGTTEWLSRQNDLVTVVEKDDGMYQALNKGIKMANAKYLGYLNCDEQYFEDTLRTVIRYFEKYPFADILFGNKVNVNEDGSFNSFKKSMRYSKNYILSSNLYIPSCALFFRNNVFDQGHYFDESFKSCGDAEFLVRLGDHGLRFKKIDRYFSSFTIRKNNLSQNPESFVERRGFEQSHNFGVFEKSLYTIPRVLEKLLTGRYFQKFPFEYSIYTKDSLKKRSRFIAKKGSFVTNWKME